MNIVDFVAIVGKRCDQGRTGVIQHGVGHMIVAERHLTADDDTSVGEGHVVDADEHTSQTRRQRRRHLTQKQLLSDISVNMGVNVNSTEVDYRMEQPRPLLQFSPAHMDLENPTFHILVKGFSWRQAKKSLTRIYGHITYVAPFWHSPGLSQTDTVVVAVGALLNKLYSAAGNFGRHIVISQFVDSSCQFVQFRMVTFLDVLTNLNTIIKAISVKNFIKQQKFALPILPTLDSYNGRQLILQT